MAVRIRSLLVSGPLMVPLSGGGSVYLSPGEVTGELPDVDVTNNVKVDKLRARRLIDVEQVGEKPSGPEEPQEPEEGNGSGEEPDPGPEVHQARAPRRGTRSGQR
jgi:hypothetical protein